MSEETFPEHCMQTASGRSLVIVASSFNERYADALVNNCTEDLHKLAPALDVSLIRVPGAYEIPMVVSRVLRGSPHPDAVIALGVIIRGSTPHADLIAQAITQELLRISCTRLVPVIHEVLLLRNTAQAEERCFGDRLNRGREAARTAIAMLNLTAASSVR